MARHNLVFLLGYVTLVQIHNTANGEPYAMAYVTVARSERRVGDHKSHMKCDNPLIMTRDPARIKEMETWQLNDIVEIKGTIAAKAVGKSSFCQHCGQKNIADGVIVYVNPIYTNKRGHYDTQDECLQFLTENREVSNQAYVIGTLCREPKKLTPKEGLIVTQYQIALNRKFRIQQDAPEIRTDYPWVKSYGENALSDRAFLKSGSVVFIDGCLQARKVNRHTVCQYCGKTYDWADKALELVPYETEYLANYLTREEKEAKEAQVATDKIRGVLGALKGMADSDILPDDEITDDDIRAGIESEEM